MADLRVQCPTCGGVPSREESIIPLLDELRALRRERDEATAEVERLRILDGDREQLEQDCDGLMAATRRIENRLTAERDSLRAEVERLRETGGTALNDAYVRARDERDEYKRALRLVRLERDQFNREAIDLRAQLATVTRERDEARKRVVYASEKQLSIVAAAARAEAERDTAEAIARGLARAEIEYDRTSTAYDCSWQGAADWTREDHWRPTGDKR